MSLSVLYTDADYLCNKFDEYSAKIFERNSHIIVVTETLLKNCSDPPVYHLPLNGYSLKREDEREGFLCTYPVSYHTA